MSARWIFSVPAIALLLAAGNLTAAEKSAADKKDKKFEATCPVSGKPAIQKAVVELKDGSKVYFCCQNCPKAYKNNPEKFEAKVQRQLLETGQIMQVACPVSGHEVDDDVTAKAGNAEVAFCCENCLAKFESADEDGKLKILFANFEKGFTRQTKCPVSGKPIKPEHMVEFKGEKVYFCCPNCPKAFEANPQKFQAKLPQFAENGEARK